MDPLICIYNMEANMIRQVQKNVFTATVIAMAVAASFQIAFAKSQIDWDKKLAKGYDWMQRNDYDKALSMFQGELDKHPESGAVRTAVGMALKRKGKLAEAKASFRRATEVEPGFAEAYYELGAMLQNDKDYAEAHKCFERYMQLAPVSSRNSSVEERIKDCIQNGG